jgi:hypothetical protein
MVRSIAGMGRILADTWPALLAWYLVGSLVRASVIAFAAPIGPDNPLGALLLVPIAVLARLVSYVGMFLVLRRALVGYREVAGHDVAFGSVRESASEFIRILLATIGPFFALYAIIGLLNEDLEEYARAAVRYSLGAETSGFQVGASPLALAVVVTAFVLRWVLKVFSPRLPSWVGVPEIYLEATWVFVALTAINSLFGPVVAWIDDRQVTHWIADSREWLSSLWAPLRFAIDQFDWLTPVALQLVLLPLAWLLIASIVYLRSLGIVADDALPVPASITKRVTLGARRLPALLRDYRHVFTGTWDGLVRPVLFSGRIILRAGFTDLLIFAAAYGLLFAATNWVRRVVYVAIGAHDLEFWWVADAGVSALILAISEPLRVVLLAVAFDLCLRRWNSSRMPALADSAPLSEPART